MKEKPVVFSLSSSVSVADEVIKILNLDKNETIVRHFADGEILAKPSETVRGKHCYIIQSTCAPVTENLMEILVFCDALKRASAKEITAIIPYFGYARQDRKSKPREPISARLVADLLKTSGVDRVVTFDLHAAQIQGFFSCPVDDLTFINVLGNYFKDKLGTKDIVVVSPDHGGVVRARNLASHLDATIAIFDKRRPKPNVAEMCDIIGDVKDKTCILVDDMIDTGGTIVAASNELIKRGAKKIYVGCTHPVLSNDAIDKLENAPIEEIITSNTIKLKRESSKIKVISIAPMIAQAIDCIEEGVSIAPLYEV